MYEKSPEYLSKLQEVSEKLEKQITSFKDK